MPYFFAFFQSLQAPFRSPFPFEATVTEGDRITLPPLEIATSQALQVFQISDPTVGLKNFHLFGSTRILNESDIQKFLNSLKKLNTGVIVISGWEALMHPDFFRLCDMIRSAALK